MILALALILIIVVFLALYFWYVTIPIILLFYINSKRDTISKYFEQRKKEKLKKEYQKESNSNPKVLVTKIMSRARVSFEELSLMLGSGQGEPDSIHALYSRLHTVGVSPDKILSMKKHLIPKFATLFEYSYHAYHSIHDGTKKVSSDLNQVLGNCKSCYENYVGYTHYRADSESSGDYDWGNYEQNQPHDEYHEHHQYSNSQNSSSYGSSGKSRSGKTKRQHRTGNSQRSKSEFLVLQRLEKFDITREEAQQIFGKRWKSKLGAEDWRLFFTIKELEIKVNYDFQSRYQNSMGSLYEKILRIIKIVIEENAEMNRDYDSHREKNYSDWRHKSGSYNNSAYESPYSNYDYDWNDQNSQRQYNDSSNSHNSSQSSQDIASAFKTLELEPSATIEQVKSRYRELILKNHPDRNNSPDAIEITKNINAAYETILDATKSS